MCVEKLPKNSFSLLLSEREFSASFVREEFRREWVSRVKDVSREESELFGMVVAHLRERNDGPFCCVLQRGESPGRLSNECVNDALQD